MHCEHERGGALPLDGFVPVATLWTGPAAAFPSEESARWTLRVSRKALAEAGALALFRGRLFVHPQRFAAAIEADAIERVRRRAAGGAQ